LSGRGLCDELITRPEESYRLCCVVVCDLETSRMGAPYIYDVRLLRVKCTDLMVLLHEGQYIDLIFQQTRAILKHKLLTEILQANIVEMVTLKNQC